MPALVCPVCGDILTKEEKTYRCSAGHSYDIARQGYVNLLPASPPGRRHGDDALMISARTRFLDAGHYDRLIDEVAALADKYSGSVCDIADVGCGDGKYTLAVYERLRGSGKEARIAAIDISKHALIAASHRSHAFTLCAASCARLPLQSCGTDMLLNIFSPLESAEYLRVLRPGGTLLRVVPLERHLYGLKSLIYEKPYENGAPELEVSGFELSERRDVKYDLSLENSGDIAALFKMTPYYYKTGRADQAKLDGIDKLETRAEFAVLIYRKRGTYK